MGSDAIQRVGVCLRRYGDLSDLELVQLAQSGDHAACEYLLYKYRSLVRSKVRAYYLMGAEKDDLIQVGMIGLWEAIADYQAIYSLSFESFACICIQRHMVTAIKSATRNKQMMLNNSCSFDCGPNSLLKDWVFSEMLIDFRDSDPERAFLIKEDTREFYGQLRKLLSLFEWRVLNEYKIGRSYDEIAQALKVKTKSVDNALVRIKRKIAEVPLGHADIDTVLIYS